MANYIIISCDELTTIVVNPGENEIIPGNTYYITFTGETNPGCFTVGLDSEEPIEEGISSVTGYTDCLECLQDNNWSFIVVSCDDPGLSGPVNAIQFNEWPLGQYYQLCAPPEFEFPGCLCFNVTSISNSNIDPFFEVSGPFENCDCQLPRSANTETFLCQEICTSGGTTTISVTPPHPEWTDGYGTQVTQLNMITLGGINGLNN